MAKLYVVVVFLASLVVMAFGTSLPLSKRSDDGDPNTAVIQQLATRIDDLQSQLNAEKQKTRQLEDEIRQRVAFSAYMSHQPNVPASDGSIVPFGGVITNVGNAYDPSSSVFTAPYAGNYVFSVHADISSVYRACTLRLNGHTVVYCSNDRDMVHTSCATVLSLHAGDKVTVNHSGNAGYIDAGRETMFIGFRLS